MQTATGQGAFPMEVLTAAGQTVAAKNVANGGRLGSISDQNKEQYREYKNVKASMNADLKREQELYEKSVHARRAEEMRQRQVGIKKSIRSTTLQRQPISGALFLLFDNPLLGIL